MSSTFTARSCPTPWLPSFLAFSMACWRGSGLAHVASSPMGTDTPLTVGLWRLSAHPSDCGAERFGTDGTDDVKLAYGAADVNAFTASPGLYSLLKSMA